MKIGVKFISKAVVEGTDENFQKFINFVTSKELTALSEEEVKQIKDGALKYIQAILYDGSQAVIANVNGLLQAPTEADMRNVLEQWKQMETLMWEVKDN